VASTSSSGRTSSGAGSVVCRVLSLTTCPGRRLGAAVASFRACHPGRISDLPIAWRSSRPNIRARRPQAGAARHVPLRQKPALNVLPPASGAPIRFQFNTSGWVGFRIAVVASAECRRPPRTRCRRHAIDSRTYADARTDSSHWRNSDACLWEVAASPPSRGTCRALRLRALGRDSMAASNCHATTLVRPVVNSETNPRHSSTHEDEPAHSLVLGPMSADWLRCAAGCEQRAVARHLCTRHSRAIRRTGCPSLVPRRLPRQPVPGSLSWLASRNNALSAPQAPVSGQQKGQADSVTLRGGDSSL
jgi:hypothetical protein